MAPEIVLMQPYGKASDIFSLGVITFILVSGSMPFYDPDPSVLKEMSKNPQCEFDTPIWDQVSIVFFLYF